MEMLERGIGSSMLGESIALSSLRVDLVDSITAERLAALLAGVSTLYCLYRELDTLQRAPHGILGVVDVPYPGYGSKANWVRAKPDFANELIVSELVIGTPNFIKWLGESKALKAVGGVLGAAASVVTLAAYFQVPPSTHVDPQPPPAHEQVIQDPFVTLNESLDFTIRARESYLAGEITLDEYNRFVAMQNSATTNLLKGAPVVTVGPPPNRP